jgi:hypothetical protein
MYCAQPDIHYKSCQDSVARGECRKNNILTTDLMEKVSIEYQSLNFQILVIFVIYLYSNSLMQTMTCSVKTHLTTIKIYLFIFLYLTIHHMFSNAVNPALQSALKIFIISPAKIQLHVVTVLKLVIRHLHTWQ